MLNKNDKIFRQVLNYILIGILFLLAFIIIEPILIAIIYGLLLSYILYPVYKFILSKVKYENLSAFLICLGVFLILFILFSVILGALFNQLINFYITLQKMDTTKVIEASLPGIISSDVSSNMATSIESSLSRLLAKTTSYIGDFILNLPNLLLQILVVFLIFFFSLRDGEKAIKYLRGLSPLNKETQAKFFQQFKGITQSVLIGQIVVGIIQGIIAGVGYFIFGVPNALLLTALTVMIGVIPIIGPWLVWIPVDVYLFIVNRPGAGMGLLIYGLFLINWVDTIIRPMIVSKRTQINPAIILIGMIGGIFVFGVLGLIIGPLILAYVLLVLELYRKQTLGESIMFKKMKDYNIFKRIPTR